MKKIFLLALVPALMFSFAGCKKETEETPDDNTGGGSLTVENKQRSMLAYVTATWCGPCGSAGGPTFKAAVASKGTSEIIPLNIQTSNSRLTPIFKKPGVESQDSVFIAPIYGALLSNLNIPVDNNGSFSIPAFSMNNSYLGTSNTTSAVITDRANSFNANSPVLGVAANKSVNGNTITVNAKSKFFKEGNGEYFWSALILEKSVNGYQKVGGTDVNDYEHKYNIRASMQNGELNNQSVFGSSAFATGTVANGTEFSKTFTLNYINHHAASNPNFGLVPWNLNASNTAVAVIVWKKNGAKYEYVNGFVAE